MQFLLKKWPQLYSVKKVNKKIHDNEIPENKSESVLR
jgi:hypothetical protein